MTTTIPVSEEVRDRLKSLGSKGDSYNDILEELLDGKDEKEDLMELAGSWSDEKADSVREKVREMKREDIESQ